LNYVLDQKGPQLPISIEIDTLKYRQLGETHRDKCTRIADSLKDSDEHYNSFRDILLDMRFLPAGRVQAAMGAAKQVTPYNCFVSPTIPDSMGGIMDVAKAAAETMRLGGGIGYDFSTLRPRGDIISKTGSSASGPVSFMQIFDAVCGTVASAGHRRGAQMGVLRVDHPDIEEFIRAKQNTTNLTNFNVSIGITDAFMEAVEANTGFDLVWGGRKYSTINARNLWNEIMRSTWDWAEPGVLFIDRINEMNNLWYCETIAATNPCAEQPLPPNGACLLGSFNLVRYLQENWAVEGGMKWYFNWNQLLADIPHVVRSMDNIVDRALYPLEAQYDEAVAKRRMGLGITGFANASEALGYPYGSPDCLQFAEDLGELFANEVYQASALLAWEKGSFPLFDHQLLDAKFIGKLNSRTRELVANYGLRNSHLLSIAPTGTISLAADNISSGIEPVFSYGFDRTIQTPSGPRVERVDDYGVRVLGVRGRTADQCTVKEHLDVLLTWSKWVDSAVSKTLNVGDCVTFSEFSNIYMDAWKGGAKGCTTFRASGKRTGILVAAPQEGEGAACYIDPETGKKSCE
jgi:ribonucleoside-diphosphate reductase alpha chain